MFQLVEYRLLAYADDSTLLAVVRKPAHRPAVAASLNRDLAMIQEWFNHCCMLLNPIKTTQPTTFDHMNIILIWGPHVNHLGTPR